MAPAIQYNGAALTLETLGSRWGWEKTKVWRFFQKYREVFPLCRLPGSCGCLVWNQQYPTGTEVSLPSCEKIKRILGQIRILAGNTYSSGSDHVRLNKLVCWYSQKMLASIARFPPEPAAKSRVALFTPLLRAYFSHGWNCKNCRKVDGFCLGQKAVSEKSNEITAIPELLNKIQIKGQIITIDAMGTQKNITEKIRNKRADYVLALKRNQGELYEEVELYFSERETLEGIRENWNYISTTEKSHGQIEKREYYQTDEIGWLTQKKSGRE